MTIDPNEGDELEGSDDSNAEDSTPASDDYVSFWDQLDLDDSYATSLRTDRGDDEDEDE